MATSHQLQPLPPLSPFAIIPPFFRHSGKTCKENVKSSDISSLLMRPAPMMALSTSATRTMERSKSTKQVRIRCWRSNVPWDGIMGWCCEKCREGSWCPSVHMSFWFLCKKIGKSSKVGVFEQVIQPMVGGRATLKIWGMIGIETSKKNPCRFSLPVVLQPPKTVKDPKRHQSQKQDEPFDITFHHLPIFGETIPLVYSGEFLTLATPSNWPFRLGIVNPMVWDPYCSLGQW